MDLSPTMEVGGGGGGIIRPFSPRKVALSRVGRRGCCVNALVTNKGLVDTS